jgi:hypothetical protein
VFLKYLRSIDFTSFYQEFKTKNSLKSVFEIHTLEKMINWRVEIIREI